MSVRYMMKEQDILSYKLTSLFIYSFFQADFFFSLLCKYSLWWGFFSLTHNNFSYEQFLKPPFLSLLFQTFWYKQKLKILICTFQEAWYSFTSSYLLASTSKFKYWNLHDYHKSFSIVLHEQLPLSSWIPSSYFSEIW